MSPGSVFFDTQFHFHDGEDGAKLFVSLGSEKGLCIVAKTTSQPHGRGINFGCQPKDRFHNFYLPVNSCFFKKNTWICLDEFYELKITDLIQKRFNGKVNHVCNLPDEITRAVQDCAIISFDITPLQESIIRNSLVAPLS